MPTCEKERLLDQLIGQLKSADADVRTEAADRIRREVPSSSWQAVIDRLVDQLDGKHYDVRWRAARALSLIGTARGDVLDALTGRLTDNFKFVRRWAAEALARIGAAHADVAGHDGVTDALNACLDDDCEEVRRAAEQALQAIEGDRASGSSSAEPSNGEPTNAEIREGKIYEGKVKAIKDYGAFVEILPERVGLVHISELGHGYIEDVSDYCQPGDCIRVELLEVSGDGDLSLTRRPFVEESPWDGVEDKYSVGDTTSGEVVSTTDFGAFVELGAGVTGLVHVSEMGTEQVDHASDVVSVGQQVTTEILEISAEDEKISLRLKQLRPKNQADRAVQGAQHRNGQHPENGRPEREVLLVDGSNVCRSWATPSRAQEASLNVLLTLLLALVEQGYDFECIFDASIPHVLQSRAESEAEATRRHLANELPDRMSRVPGGTDADGPILQKADERDLRVVTNDRFREKRETYPWIERRESERLIKGGVHGTDLQVVSLGLFTEVRTDTRRVADQLVEAVEQNGGDALQDHDSSEGRGSRSTGTLKWFDPEKGFGFVETEDPGEDLFLHESKIRGATTGRDLQKRQGVEFEVKRTPKGPQAVNVSPLE
jgi:predicted RNA-binding protein with RPS1 domain/cold shock CspA family protein